MKRYLDEEIDGNDGSTTSGWTPTKSAEVSLIDATRRQYQRAGSGISKEAKKRRLVGWLQRRGHSWDDIRHLLRLVEEERIVDGSDVDEEEDR